MRVPVTGPRYLDPHQASRIQKGSSQRYRIAVAPFLSWLIYQRLTPQLAAEFDDLVVGYKNALPITKSAFEGLVAGLEHCLPHFRGHLPWAHAVLNSWSAAHQTAHTVPMCSGPACLIAAHLSADGHGRLAAGVVIQGALGLRPAELLGITGGDVALPENASFSNPSFATIGLGVREGTKAKRAQCVLLRNRKYWVYCVGYVLELLVMHFWLDTRIHNIVDF